MFICFGKSKNLSSEVCRSVFLGLLGLTLSPVVIAQSSTPSSSTILSQASQAFSSGKQISAVEMTGTAKWTAGSTKDSGPVKLTAKITGENTAEFDLGDGTRIEKQSALAEDRTCTWSGKDGVEHDVASANCWTATVWFLPHLALQSTGLPTALGVQDAEMRTGKAGSSPHIEHRVSIAPITGAKSVAAAALPTQIQNWSKTDLALDPATFFPATLKYKLHPDDNSFVNLQVEVRYSGYKEMSGIQVPTHIERYVNGSLQVSIDIASAVVN